ncbi:MAG: hypothetical protein IJ198_11740 [Lachnospiraceae bacterium]|nr:hypothetical protein [Lachnospiraceae bacterium]
MAKVEQFPDQSGKNGITEDVKERGQQENSAPALDQKTKVMPEELRERAETQVPDDGLLMGRDIGKSADHGKTSGVGEAGSERGKDGEKGKKQSRKKAGLFRIGSILPGSEDDKKNLSYEEQIDRHRSRIRAYRLFGVVILVMVLLLAALFFNTRHYSRAEIKKIRDFVAEEGAVCVNFDGYVLQYGPNGAACADTNGRVRWTITYEMDQPIISMSGDVAAIADYGGTTIYVMNTRKQLYTVSTSLPIHKISASESGGVAAILDDRSKTWIRLYSKEGKEIAYFIRSMRENGYPMDVAVSPDGRKVCVSSLLMKDAEVISNLSFYNFGKEGQDYEQHLVGNFEYTNEVFPYVRFLGNKSCAAASDSRLVVFDTSSTEPQNSFNNMLTEDMQGIFESGGRIALLFTDLTRENLYRLDIYGRNGKKAGSIGFTMVYDDIQIKGDRIYINNEQSMQIFTLSGREIFNGGFDRTVKALIPSLRLGGLAAVTENEIDSIKLR